ncbi:unnamed protein product [Prorocentrum cordatum]|uniref:Cilia- and flagella-associated protein 157 n=1 Tax=Prorocentrum cordatum TaxID=2364126 RepID=A0ABN9WZW3_9DINO|nr:unnamed protein product [Polarella glacialis]
MAEGPAPAAADPPPGEAGPGSAPREAAEDGGSAGTDDWELQKVAYEEQVRDLAVRLAQEQAARAEDARKAARALRQARAELEAKVEEVRRRGEAEVAAANARAREAEDPRSPRPPGSASTRIGGRRAPPGGGPCRRGPGAGGGPGGRALGAVPRERAADAGRAGGERQRASAQEVELERRRKDSVAVDEMSRHIEAIERECEEQRAMQEANFSVKQARLDEWRAKQKRQNDEATQRNQTLLELEKSLHTRSLERTMGRIARHMAFGDGDVRGDETPTRQVLQRAVLDDVPWMPETPRTGRRHFGLVGEAVVDGPAR